MDIGDRIIRYTHEGSDNNHYTVDRLAFVTGVVNEDILDVVVFPPGGPVTFERLYLYDPEGTLNPPGGTYWREEGSDPPDFTNDYRHYNDRRFQSLIAKQQQELATVAEKDREAMLVQHEEAQDALMAELDGKKPEAKPVESDADRLVRLAAKQRKEEAAREREIGAHNATDMGRRV